MRPVLIHGIPPQVSSLIVGTEAKQLLFLDPACSAIEFAVALPSVPTHIVAHGLLNADYRVSVACRDGIVYEVKNKALSPMKVECGSLPCGLVRTSLALWVGTVDRQLHSFNSKGQRVWSTTLPAAICAMSRMCVQKAEVADCCCVALEGGEVRVFNGPACVAKLVAPDTITGAQ